jgi:hypothetical protein
MESENFNGYNVWGHAVLQREDVLMQGRYAACGTSTQNNKLVDASGVLGYFDTEEDAQQAGLAWARAWFSVCSQRRNSQLHYGSSGSSSCICCARGTLPSGLQKAREPQLFEVKFGFYAMQDRIVDAPCFLEL